MFESIFRKFSVRDPEFYFGTVIDRRHRIIALNTSEQVCSISKLINTKIKSRVDILCGLWWSTENFKDITKLLYIIFRNYILYPNIKIHILCNTLKEYNYLKWLGVNCIYCNHNAFVDETVFNILPGQTKRFNAVYNAVLREFKRHYLCENIDELVLVTYNFNNVEYYSQVKELLKGAIWLNFIEDESSPRMFNNDELCKIYNESHIGLALSKIEGAMYASIEYLLCGIPVVSTVSRGGRDVFFNSKNSAICLDTKEDVQNKIDIMKKRNIDPIGIRNEAIELMQEHRDIFISYINGIYKKRSVNEDAGKTWGLWFINKLRNEYSADQLLDELQDDIT